MNIHLCPVCPYKNNQIKISYEPWVIEVLQSKHLTQDNLYARNIIYIKIKLKCLSGVIFEMTESLLTGEDFGSNDLCYFYQEIVYIEG